MESKTEVANLALSHLGIMKEIGDLDNELSNEARAIKRIYDTSLKKILGDFPWTFTTTFQQLALVQSNPTTEWGYAYRYPAQCLTVRRIFSGTRTDSHDTRIPYKLGRDLVGKLIYCDVATPMVEFTYYENDVTKWPDDFCLAFSFLLAYLAAPRITGGDPYKLGDRAFQNYIQHLSSAESTALQEEQPDVDPDCGLIQVRN